MGRNEPHKAGSTYTDVLSGATASALGLVSTGGSDGGIVAATFQPVIKRGLNNILEFVNSLTGRQQKRAATAIEVAMAHFVKRIEAEDDIRDDGFFDFVDERTPFEELLEAVTTKCRDQYQQKKARHIACILANACFVNSSPAGIISVIEAADRLTFRQFCYLELFHHGDWDLRAYDFLNQGRELLKEEERFLAIQECYDLNVQGVIEQRPPNVSGFGKISHPYAVKPRFLKLTAMGNLTRELLDLKTLEPEDLIKSAEWLK